MKNKNNKDDQMGNNNNDDDQMGNNNNDDDTKITDKNNCPRFLNLSEILKLGNGNGKSIIEAIDKYHFDNPTNNK